MSTTGHWYIICYDIRSPRRLQKVHKFLRKEAYQLQESVFTWFGNQHDLESLQQELLSRIHPGNDDLRGYRLPTHISIQFWGSSPFLSGIIDSGYPPYTLESEHHELFDENFSEELKPDEA